MFKLKKTFFFLLFLEVSSMKTYFFFYFHVVLKFKMLGCAHIWFTTYLNSFFSSRKWHLKSSREGKCGGNLQIEVCLLWVTAEEECYAGCKWSMLGFEQLRECGRMRYQTNLWSRSLKKKGNLSLNNTIKPQFCPIEFFRGCQKLNTEFT